MAFFGKLKRSSSLIWNETPILVIENRVFISQSANDEAISSGGAELVRLLLSDCVQYMPFCDDFGPFDLSCIATFIKMLDRELESNPSGIVVIQADVGKRERTNAVFLCGAYLMMKLQYTVEQVEAKFRGLKGSAIVPFRDATFSVPDFELYLTDCWRGLDRGLKLGWFNCPSTSDSFFWGHYDIDEYKHYQDPLNADIHEVVPGKFFAFRGPAELGDQDYRDSADGYREFSPQFYIDIFQERGIAAVIRLNEPTSYRGKTFWDHGIAHYDLEFEDCTAPPKHIVELFFAICDRAGGPVAVHCKAGLGRTGTLIALYLMRAHAFHAREAIGWLRIVRPGSVIGRQQHYLCAAEDASLSLEELEDASESPDSRLPVQPSPAAAAAEEAKCPSVRSGQWTDSGSSCNSVVGCPAVPSHWQCQNAELEGDSADACAHNFPDCSSFAEAVRPALECAVPSPGCAAQRLDWQCCRGELEIDSDRRCAHLQPGDSDADADFGPASCRRPERSAPGGQTSSSSCTGSTHTNAVDSDRSTPAAASLSASVCSSCGCGPDSAAAERPGAGSAPAAELAAQVASAMRRRSTAFAARGAGRGGGGGGESVRAVVAA